MDDWYQVTQLLLVSDVLVEYWIFIIINGTRCAAIVSLYFFVVEKNHVAKVLNSLMYVTAFFVLTYIRIFEYHKWQVKCKNRDTGNNNCNILNILTLQYFPIQF